MSTYTQSIFYKPEYLMNADSIKATMIVPGAIPFEIWGQISNYLPFKNLQLFTEYKVKVLKKPLTGEEDRNRLMMGTSFIFNRKNFLEVVKDVYDFACVCRTFYLVTQRERTLLIKGSEDARCDRTFLGEKLCVKEKDKNVRFASDFDYLPTHLDLLRQSSKIKLLTEKLLPESTTFKWELTMKQAEQQSVFQALILSNFVVTPPKKILEQTDLLTIAVGNFKLPENLLENIVLSTNENTELEKQLDSNDKTSCVIL